jgi:hypothetical protein
MSFFMAYCMDSISFFMSCFMSFILVSRVELKRVSRSWFWVCVMVKVKHQNGEVRSTRKRVTSEGYHYN